MRLKGYLWPTIMPMWRIESGLKAINISNFRTPSIVSAVDTGYASGIYVAGNYAYVANETGLKIIDISDPRSPGIVGSVDTGYASGIYVAGNYAYVADGWTGLKIIDISNPRSPNIVGSVNTSPIEF